MGATIQTRSTQPVPCLFQWYKQLPPLRRDRSNPYKHLQAKAGCHSQRAI
ncbi:hypothetical protein [Oscillatoria sp. FACHB-1406]|nr:hypothetical protein [Oscillatoria sp. FACHB-1406]MBD2577083.1 hypothetical protein [Oscillatoria sp. FACHB-1406]